MNRTQVVKYPAFQTFTVSSTEAQVEFTHSFFVGLSIPISEIYYGSPIDGIHWFVVA